MWLSEGHAPAIMSIEPPKLINMFKYCMYLLILVVVIVLVVIHYVLLAIVLFYGFVSKVYLFFLDLFIIITLIVI